MQMDFYQLGGTPPEQVIASIAGKILAQDGRLLVVASDEGALARPTASFGIRVRLAFCRTASRAAQTMRGNRSSFRLAPTLPISRETC